MIQDPKDFEKRILTYYKETNKLAKKLKLKVNLVVDFKNIQRRAPLMGKIGMFLLQRSGGILDTHFTNLK